VRICFNDFVTFYHDFMTFYQTVFSRFVKMYTFGQNVDLHLHNSQLSVVSTSFKNNTFCVNFWCYEILNYKYRKLTDLGYLVICYNLRT